ncbi:homoserine kinase [Paenibacillus donghaensis]|uniref:homoserine kinase n=1 Tax=Paenibacillus donghaensis TaxID=414771 RepID=UPI0018848A70|nr:homoserine kinase [Paenibacillus donghaensis]MBE9917768.1 homoserine kinase [Paenibacillus donghaensis]
MFFPVSYSTLSDQAINEFLKNQYGLDGTARTGYLLRGMNDTYLVTTAGQKYVFRVYRGDWRTNESEIVFEMELLQHLDKQGISVSLPIPDRQGNIIQKLQAPEGTRFAVLFTFAEGEERGIDSEEISERFGKDVAGIHLHSASFHSSNTRQELNLDYLISQALDFIHPRMTHREQDFRELQGLAGKLEELLHDIGLDTLDWGVCHGDLHGNTNVSYRDDGSMTHYDFDLCGYGWRAYDIAEFRLAREVRLGHDPQQLELLWNAFLKGYQSVRTLSENDLRAVPVFVAIRQLWLFGLCMMDPHIMGSIDSGDDFIDEKLDYFKSLSILKDDISA